MENIFTSTLNTRPILSDSFHFVRSDVLNRITEQETEWLLSHNITTVIDLRADGERKQKECPLVYDNRFQYCCMLVSGGGH